MTGALELQVIGTAALGAEQRAEIVALCEAAHQADFQKLFDYLPDDGLHVLAWLDGRIAGHAVRTTRWAQPPGHPPLKTAYIDAVSTAPELQGRGIGSAVMRRLAAAIQDEDYQLCALETHRPGFYTRLGWEAWPGPLAGRRGGALVPTPDDQGHVLILRLATTPELYLSGMLSIEDQGRFW
jgi:aminoglycoside 2'-N-acetyltransferase I